MIPPDARRNRLLKAACAALIVFIGSTTLIQLASIPRYYQRVSAGAVPTVTMGAEVTMSNEVIDERAADRGLTRPAYALYSIGLNLITVFIFGSVAVVILWKARQDWFHWFTAFVLLLYPTSGLWELTQVSQIGFTYVALNGLLWPSFLLFLYLFPNGRAVPSWTRWLMAPILLIHLGVQAVGLVSEVGWTQNDRLFQSISPLFGAVGVGFLLILICQIYRYGRKSDSAERAQTRWFVVGFVVWLVVSGITDPGDAPVKATGLAGDIGQLFSLLVPLSIGVAILRYRLYDIDLIVRRTLIYGVLTGALGATYLGSVVLLQRLVGGRTGETAQWVIVVSTLVIAALFRPLHRRIQTVIDRRFYRRRYNAQETLAAFSAKLRAPDHAVLDNLTGELLEVVQATMQPAHASLWLRKLPGPAKPDAPSLR